jgi:hypothetical protein
MLITCRMPIAMLDQAALAESAETMAQPRVVFGANQHFKIGHRTPLNRCSHVQSVITDYCRGKVAFRVNRHRGTPLNRCSHAQGGFREAAPFDSMRNAGNSTLFPSVPPDNQGDTKGSVSKTLG